MTTDNTGSKRSFVNVELLPHSRLTDDDRLESRNADQFGDAEVAEIVHDFRNTLTAVSLLCELMLQKLPEDSPARKMGGNVRLACKDAQALCERMLAESRGTRDSRERIDRSNLVTGMEAMLATCVPATSVLRFDLAADLPSLNFAPVAMRQIVMNLVRNAAEALGDRPGMVTVSTGWIELDAADLQEGNGCGWQRPGRHVYLAVSDTGCGMDEETKTRLLAGTCTTKANGNGLGLASVRRIAAAHRADLQIESRVGEGTTVRVLFDKGAPVCRENPTRSIGPADTVNPAVLSRSDIAEESEEIGPCPLVVVHSEEYNFVVEGRGTVFGAASRRLDDSINRSPILIGRRVKQ